MHWALASLASWLDTYLIHPLSGPGYQWWSGAGSDVTELALIGGLVGAWRKVNCHQHRCWRMGRFRHGQYVLCQKHHPLVPDDGRITAEHIDEVQGGK